MELLCLEDTSKGASQACDVSRSERHFFLSYLAESRRLQQRAVSHRSGGRGLIHPFPAHSSKHHFCKSMHTQLDQSAPPAHFILEDVGSPLVKSGGQSSFGPTFTTYAPRRREGKKNVTAVGNCRQFDPVTSWKWIKFPTRRHQNRLRFKGTVQHNMAFK